MAPVLKTAREQTPSRTEVVILGAYYKPLRRKFGGVVRPHIEGIFVVGQFENRVAGLTKAVT